MAIKKKGTPASKSRTDRTDKKKALFIEELRHGWSVLRASQKSAISRTMAYEYKKKDAKFSDDWDAAIEDGTDVLEDMAHARALKMSDTLLIFMLKARRPNKYREQLAGEKPGDDITPPTKEIKYGVIDGRKNADTN